LIAGEEDKQPENDGAIMSSSESYDGPRGPTHVFSRIITARGLAKLGDCEIFHVPKIL